MVLKVFLLTPKTIQKITMRKAIESLFTLIEPALNSLGSTKYN